MNNSQDKKGSAIKNRVILDVLLYIVFVIVLSGLLLILHFIFTKVGDYDVSFTQYAPLLALIALLIIRRSNKDMLTGVKERFKINLKSIIYSLVLSVALLLIFLVLNFILIALNKPYSSWESPSFALSVVFVLLGCITEEIGWRGYLLPELNKKFSILVSSIFIGIFWGVWHLNFSEGIVGFLVYTLFITSLSIIMSYIQAKNGFKLLPAVVFHFFINLFFRVILFNRINWQAYLILAGIFIIISAILFLVDRKTFLFKQEIKDM